MPETLSAQLEQLVQEELATGKYQSRDEVLLTAVRLLREQAQAIAGIQRGLDSMERAGGLPLQEGIRQLRQKLDIPSEG